MNDLVERFRKGEDPLPTTNLGWPIYAAGLENVGRNREPVAMPMPVIGPDELLARIDAVGLCFSDIKLIKAGPEHPRIRGRDLAKEPAIGGHETSITIVGVGENLRDKYRVGERFIVQADIYYKGKNIAFGYMLPGALEQFTVIGKEMLEGDEGVYLLPVKDETGYAQAALVEPWACVVASYLVAPRETMKPGGTVWAIGGEGSAETQYRISKGFDASTHPAKIVCTDIPPAMVEALRQHAGPWGVETVVTSALAGMKVADMAAKEAPGGFDDVIVLGAIPKESLLAATQALGRHGIMALVTPKPFDARIPVDVGRVHYDYIHYVGSTSTDIAEAYRRHRTSELVPGGAAWFIGAGGPMGQMHVERALHLSAPPRLIVASDVDPDRLETVRAKNADVAEERGIEFLCLNPQEMGMEAFEAALREKTGGKGFDDIVLLAPVAPLITHGIQFLAENGILNIFAGLPVGTTAELDLSEVATKRIRLVGTSGSTIADLQVTLDTTESGRVSTNRSVAAVGSIHAGWEGLDGVANARFLGKVVLFPHIEYLPLTTLAELPERLPGVARHLDARGGWTCEAEEALLRAKLPLPGQPVQRDKPGLLEGQTAIVTGAAQGLGEALSRRLAQEGCRVVVADLQTDKAEQVAAAIQSDLGRRAIAVQCDVTSAESVQAMVERTLDEFGCIDLLIANAGILIAGGIEEFDPEKWRKVIEVNLFGYFLCARYVAPVMMQQRRGSIIQINSKSGKKGSFRNSAYPASKFGGIGLTQSLALELAPYGVRVNAVCPGNLLDSPLWVDSLYEQYAKRWGLTVEQVRRKYEDQVPLGRGCSYDDVANVVVFLASDQASYMTGQAINVTGGQEMR
jgi:NAD(P)-dependent dehydrogenase (short-subunit alcohol dehydrogenase family)/threonine dehydrogenase-like Zn-dependent dehydrogenase